MFFRSTLKTLCFFTSLRHAPQTMIMDDYDCNCSTATYSFSYILLAKVAKSSLRFVWDLPALEGRFRKNVGGEIMHISSTIRWGLLVKLTKMSFMHVPEDMKGSQTYPDR